MTLLIVPSSHPTQWETTKPHLNRERYLTEAGAAERTKVQKVNGRWVWWLGFAYTVVQKRVCQGFYPTLSEAIQKAESL